MIKLNSAIPLYQQVAEDLKNRIEQGEFCSGQSIPSEAKLCEQYEVSRITIRNAIAELVEQEILVKYQGKGVFVRSNFFISQMLEGMQAGVGAVIASVTYEMGAGIVKEKDAVSVGIMIGAFIVSCIFGVNVVLIILVCGLLGVIRTLFAKRREMK